jgi:hypothetical protein
LSLNDCTEAFSATAQARLVEPAQGLPRLAIEGSKMQEDSHAESDKVLFACRAAHDGIPVVVTGQRRNGDRYPEWDKHWQ